MKKILLITSILFLAYSCTAQKAITGKLDYWPNGKTDVITIKDGPEKIGSVDEKGMITIPLKEDYLKKASKQKDTANTNSQKWEVATLTVWNVFACTNQKLELKNVDQPITKLSSYGVFDLADIEKKKKYGFFIAANSKKFAEAYTSYGQKNAEKGYAIDYYYVAESAQIKGICYTVKYTGNNDENFEIKKIYNLNFKKGWNIVKYQIEELHTAQDGKVYASTSSYETLENVPEDIQYIFFED